jgi:prepilin-type N-terminal cleavage/methylation domain-containing protein
MLKINKILSKKIKFPLSLRGLFPFCHSRESGNLSFLSFRGVKQQSNLNHNGFSLIELMIAVTILALAVFGIFHAYSVGFMGMADARDRTVATNYAREAMEDVKNMDFEKIVTTTKSVITSNIKYRVDVNVSLESPNLKKVFTVVGWKDRNGVGKTVETSMLVHFIEIYASKPSKIVLYADSYGILNTSTIPGATSTKLTAVIKDIKGNTIIDWNGGDISFSIKSGDEFGNLSNITTTTNGMAEATFTSDGVVGVGDVGTSVIEALVTLPDIGDVSDSVTIKITNGPVKIILEPDPDTIKASTANCPTITASLRDAAGFILKKNDLVIDVEINFSVFGEGNLSTSTITILADDSLDDASVTIDLCPTGNPGLASVVATATDLESGTTNVCFLGTPVSISISADPNPMYVDDDFSTITVSLIDVNGFCTNPTGEDIDVTFLLSPNTNGSLSPSSLSFTDNEYEGISKITYFSEQHSTEEVTINTVNGVGLTDGSVTIKFLSALEPDHFKLTASPQNVAVGDISIIKATIYDGSKIATNYDGTITFETTRGAFTDYNLTNGIATVKLSSGSAGIAIITAFSSDGLDCIPVPENGVVVGFYATPDHIKLTTSSQDVKIGTGNSCTITATVYDNVEGNNIIVTNYDGTITFDTTLGDFTGINPTTTTNGIATIELSSVSAGTATVTASSSTGLTPGSVEVEFYEEITLILVDDSVNCTPTCDIITFGVIVTGGNEDSIEVDEMKIIWTESSSQERFSKIVIDSVEVYTGGNDKSATIVDILNKTLVPVHGEYSIEFTFAQDMAERHIDVMFYPPGEGWYLIRFDVPVSS